MFDIKINITKGTKVRSLFLLFILGLNLATGSGVSSHDAGGKRLIGTWLVTWRSHDDTAEDKATHQTTEQEANNTLAAGRGFECWCLSNVRWHHQHDSVAEMTSSSSWLSRHTKAELPVLLYQKVCKALMHPVELSDHEEGIKRLEVKIPVHGNV